MGALKFFWEFLIYFGSWFWDSDEQRLEER